MPANWANPITTRSALMLEIASALVAGPDTSLRQTKVMLREQGADEWGFCRNKKSRIMRA